MPECRGVGVNALDSAQWSAPKPNLTTYNKATYPHPILANPLRPTNCKCGWGGWCAVANSANLIQNKET